MVWWEPEEDWLSVNIEHQLKSKLAWLGVYKEYEVKIKMVHEQWLQLKIKFLLRVFIKFLVGGGIFPCVGDEQIFGWCGAPSPSPSPPPPV